MRTDTLLRRVGNWWLVRGRHHDGFLKLDALNYTEAQALAERERLLPVITDAEVQVMADMLVDALPEPAEGVAGNDLTPERAREMPAAAWAIDRIIAAWERDRAELLQRRRECARCGQTGLHPDGVHSCYDLSALSADYYQQWQEARAERDALRERLAVVTAQRDALVPIAAVVEAGDPADVGNGGRADVRSGGHAYVWDGGRADVQAGGLADVWAGGRADVWAGGRAHLREPGAVRRVWRDGAWHTEVARGERVTLVDAEREATRD